jgi:hypothetical protein
MRTLHAACGLMLGLSLSALSAPMPDEPAAASQSPITIRAYANQTAYTLGEPVQFYLLLENVSDTTQQFNANMAMDKGLQVFITPLYQRTRRFVDRATGAIMPSAMSMEPGEVRGVFQHLHWSTIGDGSLAFPDPGMYRIDIGVTLAFQDGFQITDTQQILADPISIQIFEPLTDAEREASEIMRQPEVARSLQLRNPSEAAIPELERLIEVAGDTLFSEHAHFLLGMNLAEQEEFIPSNRHLYAVYEQEDWFYPKDMILIGILTNYHWADEPERALAVCQVLLELYPEDRERRHPMVEIYRSLLAQREEV